jgi:hypothetical protein
MHDEVSVLKEGTNKNNYVDKEETKRDRRGREQVNKQIKLKEDRFIMRGGNVVVKALCYKPEGGGFYIR